MFYARFNVSGSDVAVFKTKKARDDWLKAESFFDRIPITEEEAAGMVNLHSNPVTEPIEPEVGWLLVRR